LRTVTLKAFEVTGIKIFNMRITKRSIDDLTYKIIGAAIEVHQILGPGLLESVYEKCFLHELTLRGINWSKQKRIWSDYKGIEYDTELRYDVLVEDLILTELKSVEEFHPIHPTILLSYMRMMKKPKGILISFNCKHIFKQGQKTLVNEYYSGLPDK